MLRSLGMFACVLACLALLAAFTPRAARAQHVLTDTEAGKLTFGSLIAQPRPIPRYIPHLAVRRVSDEHRVPAEPRAHRPSRVSRLIHASSMRRSHRSHVSHLHRSGG